MPFVAGMDQQQPIGLRLPIMGGAGTVQIFGNFGPGAIRQIARHRLGQNLGPGGAVCGRDHTRVGQSRRIHEAQCGEAVEPCIGCLLDDMGAVAVGGGLQLGNCLGMFTAGRCAVG